MENDGGAVQADDRERVMMIPFLVLTLYLATINVATFLFYWIDKEQAALHGWQISESTLLLLGLSGGTIGAFLAQRAFRHKTAKSSFQRVFWFIATLQMAIGVFLAVFYLPDKAQ